MAYLHQNLANGGWYELSLAEQMGNIGSEVSRASLWQGKDEKLFWSAVERGLELFDLTLQDARWKGKLYEIARAREVYCDAVYGGPFYKSTFKDLQPYFDQFALMARSKI